MTMLIMQGSLVGHVLLTVPMMLTDFSRKPSKIGNTLFQQLIYFLENKGRHQSDATFLPYLYEIGAILLRPSYFFFF